MEWNKEAFIESGWEKGMVTVGLTNVHTSTCLSPREGPVTSVHLDTLEGAD